jgi:DNA processing protein
VENTLYYLAFNTVYGIGIGRLERLIAVCGSLQAAWHANLAQMQAAGFDAATCTSLQQAQQSLDLQAEYQQILDRGIRLISRDDAEYPSLLQHIPNAPPLLYTLGSFEPSDEWAIAVVGTRKPSTYGIEVTRRLVAELVEAGITIVSGLAIGIDGLAHKTALEHGGRTLAVLGTAINQMYPEANRAVAQQIPKHGALLSEFPLKMKPTPNLFPVRNRLISGLSLGTLVVEAGEKSGALLTTNYALEQGREVFAVPGPIYSPRSVGTNNLLRDGACVVTCAQDILDTLNLSTLRTQHEVQVSLPSDPTEAALLALLSFEPQHIDEIGRQIALPFAEVSSSLAIMELKGLIRQSTAMHYVRVR